MPTTPHDSTVLPAESPTGWQGFDGPFGVGPDERSHGVERVGWQAPVTGDTATTIPTVADEHEVPVDRLVLPSRMSGAYDVNRSAFDVAATALFTADDAPARGAIVESGEIAAENSSTDAPAAESDDTAVPGRHQDNSTSEPVDDSRETPANHGLPNGANESVIPTARHMRSLEIAADSVRQQGARPSAAADPSVADVDGVADLDSADLDAANMDAGSTPAPTRPVGTIPAPVAPLPKPATTRVLTIANQKGGVGKTTTTVNVAAALAQAGLTVLVIDMDPQGNASTALGVDHRAEVPSIYDVLIDERPLAEVVSQSPDVAGLWCAPATIDLAGAEIELVSLVARESRLQRAITALLADESHTFDYLLIDCPPSLGLLTVNAFVAAQEVFIPIQCEYYALEGLSQLLKNVDLIRKHLNPALRVGSILMTMYDARTRLSAQVADEVRNHFPERVLKTRIPRSVRISEAPSFGQTVMSYDPVSSGALSYREAARELATREVAL